MVNKPYWSKEIYNNLTTTVMIYSALEHVYDYCTDLQRNRARLRLLYWSQALKNTLTTTEPISSAIERLYDCCTNLLRHGTL